MSNFVISSCRLFFSVLILLSAVLSTQLPQWEQLPPTPHLPKLDDSGTVAANGIRIWYAVFGDGEPVILVHGALGNSNYWGLQVPPLARHYKVIVLDSRGQGRTTWSSEPPLSFHLMASDVLALMDALHISKAALVGWSDGGIIGLDIAIHNPERLTKLFAFGANSDPSAKLRTTFNRSRLFRGTSAEPGRNTKSSHRRQISLQRSLNNWTRWKIPNPFHG